MRSAIVLDALDQHVSGERFGADEACGRARYGRTEGGVHWGPLPPLAWRSGAESGLSKNAKVLPIVRGAGTRIPLIRKS